MNFDPSPITPGYRSVCVYCGSRPGHDPAYAALAEELGVRMAAEGVRLVYGGGSIGLMGILARSIVKAGGEAVGIIPHFLDKLEVAQGGLTELIKVDNMHERKALMADMSDAFATLPGGAGTLDELMEITTWAQLKLHEKPIFVLNYKQYWDPFFALIEHVVEQGFAGPETLPLLTKVDDLDALMAVLRDPELAEMREHKQIFKGDLR